MADNAAFRAMFADPALGLSDESARELVIVNGVNTMPRLAGMDRERVQDVVHLIRKTTVPGPPPRRLVFPEVAAHNLMMAGTIAKNYRRIDRVISPAEIVTMFGDEEVLELHKAQRLLEKNYDNTLGASYFKPLTERTCREVG